MQLNLTLRSRLSLGQTRRSGAFEQLSEQVEARDHTAHHSRRVRRIALAVATELGLQAGKLAAVGQAALFHDIGKLSVPDEILLKPAGLTAKEWELMRCHSDEGARMLEAVGLFVEAVPAIRHHHERFDGTGYPAGLAGEDIPLAARIVHVADALDSMLTTRVYRPGRSPEEAMAEVRRGAGSQFCPSCVGALERTVASGKLADLGLGEPSLAPAR
jgi:putative nucleotidyltransferase with HDIG domain